jgi:hypothetical protein
VDELEGQIEGLEEENESLNSELAVEQTKVSRLHEGYEKAKRLMEEAQDAEQSVEKELRDSQDVIAQLRSELEIYQKQVNLPLHTFRNVLLTPEPEFDFGSLAPRTQESNSPSPPPNDDRPVDEDVDMDLGSPVDSGPVMEIGAGGRTRESSVSEDATMPPQLEDADWDGGSLAQRGTPRLGREITPALGQIATNRSSGSPTPVPGTPIFFESVEDFDHPHRLPAVEVLPKVEPIEPVIPDTPATPGVETTENEGRWSTEERELMERDAAEEREMVGGVDSAVEDEIPSDLRSILDSAMDVDVPGMMEASGSGSGTSGSGGPTTQVKVEQPEHPVPVPGPSRQYRVERLEVRRKRKAGEEGEGDVVKRYAEIIVLSDSD